MVGDSQCCKLSVLRGDRHVWIYASPDNWLLVKFGFGLLG